MAEEIIIVFFVFVSFTSAFTSYGGNAGWLLSHLIADYVHLQDMQCTVTEAAGVTPTGIVGQSACLYLHWMITDWQSRRLYASYYVVPRQLTTWRLRAMSGHKLNTLLGSGLRQQLTVTAVDDKVAPRQPLTTESYRSVTCLIFCDFLSIACVT